MKHPMQPIALDDNGTARFKANKIVRFLLDAGPFDLNMLALMPFDQEDRVQLAQLIGYSVSGYGDLPYALDVHRADEIVEGLLDVEPVEPVEPVERVWHHMPTPGVAACSADYPNMQKTSVDSRVTCPGCKTMMGWCDGR